MARLPTTSALRAVLGLLLVLALGAGVAVVVRAGGGPDSGASGGSDGASARRSVPAPAPPTVSTLADLGRAAITVARGTFCDRVDPRAVEDALGGPVATGRTYGNGDTAQVDPGTTDVAHEFGCTWTSGSGAVARAWVFAPPVTRARARRLTRTVPAARGCSTYAADGFGEPGVSFTCTGTGLVSAGHGGLFGDAWLTCTVADPVALADPVDVEQRADRWCVSAAVGAALPAPE